MVLKRLDQESEKFNWGGETQNGFRKNRGTNDSLLASRLIAALTREKGQSCWAVFVDNTKAYDLVNRELLWAILEKRGVPPKLLQLIKQMHIGARGKVKFQGSFSEEFDLMNGLMQGSVISPLLFNIFIVPCFRQLKKSLKRII